MRAEEIENIRFIKSTFEDHKKKCAKERERGWNTVRGKRKVRIKKKDERIALSERLGSRI